MDWGSYLLILLQIVIGMGVLLLPTILFSIVVIGVPKLGLRFFEVRRNTLEEIDFDD